MKSDYHERQQRRLERAEDLAEKNRTEQSNRYGASRRTLDPIPPGQPILVGHHSEGRHRRDLARADTHMRKAREAGEKADHYERQADTIQAQLDGKGAISSDDPEAIVKLRAKIADAETSQTQMKAANRIYRSKKSTAETQLQQLIDLGLSESAARAGFEPDFAGRTGFPSYMLTNNNANIRRMKARLAQLEALEGQHT